MALTRDFLLIPAIDLMDGQVVRLSQGRADKKIVYSDNPPEMARSFELSGAQRLHIVDLDGAFSGKPSNFNVIRSIRERVQIPLEVGGGLRAPEDIDDLFSIGVNYAILGTQAVENPQFLQDMVQRHGDRIIVGVDSHDGKVATRGWLEVSGLDAVEFARNLESMGARTLIYTDIARDGILQGPNLEAQRSLAENIGISVIASGGVSSREDAIALASLPCQNLIGAIVGKALYSGSLNLAETLEALRA